MLSSPHTEANPGYGTDGKKALYLECERPWSSARKWILSGIKDAVKKQQRFWRHK